MESKHTGGNYLVSDNLTNYTVVVAHDKGYKTLCTITDDHGLNTPEEMKATAHLFASAPELLEALKLFVKDYWADYPENDREVFRKSNPDSNIVKAEQAINKAIL